MSEKINKINISTRFKLTCFSVYFVQKKFKSFNKKYSFKFMNIIEKCNSIFYSIFL